MNRTLKRKWIKALLSGRYKQATGTLQDEKGANCCLGVLCRVTRRPREGSSFMFASGWETGALPNYYLKEIGMTVEQQTGLINMNDRHGNSFKEIAEAIRKNL